LHEAIQKPIQTTHRMTYRNEELSNLRRFIVIFNLSNNLTIIIQECSKNFR